MKKYAEMNSEEIRQIVNRGGDKLVKLIWKNKKM